MREEKNASPAAVAGPKEAVAYLDIGEGGYLDLGSDLSDEALRKLPKGRHMLAIVGTYGVDGYVPVTAPTTQTAPVAQGDALTYEQHRAIRQGHEIAASNSYFDARPQIDNNDRRKVFEAGFERGWDAARAQAKEGGE